ncbi:MAG: ATP synthase subunit I [Clostridiales bacterium]|nr:ATP synthase subunit I [Clostridiales bacterium]
MQEVKKMTIRTIAISVLIAISTILIAYFIFDDSKPIIMGIIFGSVLGMLNFYDLFLTLSKASIMNPGKARNFAASKYILRYLFVGIVIFVSIKADYINVVGTIFGLFLIKFVIIATNLFNDRSFFMKIIKRKEEK